MADEDRRYERQLKRVVEALTSSVLKATDGEIEEEFRVAGKDSVAEAEQLKARLLELTAELRVKLTALKEKRRRDREAREAAESADGD